jgi:hypothetical protein
VPPQPHGPTRAGAKDLDLTIDQMIIGDYHSYVLHLFFSGIIPKNISLEEVNTAAPHGAGRPWSGT